MKRTSIFCALLIVFSLGCRTTEPPPDPIVLSYFYSTCASYSRTFTLSETNQVDDEAGIRLVGVFPDGTVLIRSFQTGSLLESSTNGYFPSEEFGSEGLHILEVNQADKRVVFKRYSYE